MTEENLIPPISIGDVLENQEVISEGKRNDGVVKYEGYIIFVDGAKKGDIITIKIEKILPKFGIAIKIENEDEQNE